MTAKDAARFIQILKDGHCPLTGEPLPATSTYRSELVANALSAALVALERAEKFEARKTSWPEQAGKSWEPDEDQQLGEGFDRGLTVGELAKLHKRTRNAIDSRLQKLGKFARVSGGGSSAAHSDSNA